MTTRLIQSLFLFSFLSCAIGCSGTFSGVFKPKGYKYLTTPPKSLKPPENTSETVPDSSIMDRMKKELVPVPKWWLFGENSWYFTFGH